ncbi:hypothetical protein GA0115240_12187 [Streptomyces sp. DvalAA-14]|nr:hypothetical protein GA0115240_12187 [Streptomyces sp. DvalAA-14]
MQKKSEPAATARYPRRRPPTAVIEFSKTAAGRSFPLLAWSA